ncbi:MAG: hypothetical protein UW24_C0015G0004 [Parcubacteria group bacterium GW2011_GWA2_44_12]|nr:MAG: hypothetical protein UW24_C0015G0004 [Parcubacteria group bacterium GW2011_GWA2_44_12]
MFNFLNFGSLGYFFESNALDVGMLIQISLSSVLFGFGLFVYLAQRKSWKHAIFFFYCIAIFIALYCFGLAHLAGSAKSALEWYRFGFLGLFFTPLFSYILSIVVTERYRQIPIALAGVFIHSVFFVILLVFDDLPLPSLYSFQAVIFAGIFAVQAVGTSFNLVTLYRTCISRRQIYRLNHDGSFSMCGWIYDSAVSPPQYGFTHEKGGEPLHPFSMRDRLV